MRFRLPFSALTLLLALAFSACRQLGTPSSAADPAEPAKEAADFLRRYMPESDKATMKPEAVAENVRLALEARQRFPWAREVPWEIFLNDVVPYATTTETRDPWRRPFLEKFAPVVADCRTAREAVVAINRRIASELKVKYSTSRRAPDQGPFESMQRGVASCTGLSILLIDACRAVGIPARMAGVVSWSHIPGNHNWVEVWCDGGWQMTEYGDSGFDTAWVIENCGLLDTSKWEHKVWASSWKPQGDSYYPMVWELEEDGDGGARPTAAGRSVPGVDVSARYAELARQLRLAKEAALPRQLFVDYRNSAGLRLACPVRVLRGDRVVASGTTKAGTADSRDFLRLDLPDEKQFMLEYEPEAGHPRRRKVEFADGEPLVLKLDDTPAP